jgi:hypothetical protein
MQPQGIDAGEVEKGGGGGHDRVARLQNRPSQVQSERRRGLCAHHAFAEPGQRASVRDFQAAEREIVQAGADHRVLPSHQAGSDGDGLRKACVFDFVGVGRRQWLNSLGLEVERLDDEVQAAAFFAEQERSAFCARHQRLLNDGAHRAHDERQAEEYRQRQNEQKRFGAVMTEIAPRQVEAISHGWFFPRFETSTTCSNRSSKP